MATAKCVFWFDKADEAPNTGEYIECYLRTVNALIDEGLKIEFAFGCCHWDNLIAVTDKRKDVSFGVEDLPTLKEMITDMCKEMGVY